MSNIIKSGVTPKEQITGVTLELDSITIAKSGSYPANDYITITAPTAACDTKVISITDDTMTVASNALPTSCTFTMTVPKSKSKTELESFKVHDSITNVDSKVTTGTEKSITMTFTLSNAIKNAADTDVFALVESKIISDTTEDEIDGATFEGGALVKMNLVTTLKSMAIKCPIHFDVATLSMESVTFDTVSGSAFF